MSWNLTYDISLILKNFLSVLIQNLSVSIILQFVLFQIWQKKRWDSHMFSQFILKQFLFNNF